MTAPTKAITDDPEGDGTDFAHPAWWRGNDAGVIGTAIQLHRQLDHGKAGVFGNDRLEALSLRIEKLRRERDEAVALLNTPELHDFAKAVALEAAHQRHRWTESHDEGKGPESWYWVVGHLAGKALRAAIAGDIEKALHHTISTAAILANWHAHLLGKWANR